MTTKAFFCNNSIAVELKGIFPEKSSKLVTIEIAKGKEWPGIAG